MEPFGTTSNVRSSFTDSFRQWDLPVAAHMTVPLGLTGKEYKITIQFEESDRDKIKHITVERGYSLSPKEKVIKGLMDFLGLSATKKLEQSLNIAEIKTELSDYKKKKGRLSYRNDEIAGRLERIWGCNQIQFLQPKNVEARTCLYSVKDTLDNSIRAETRFELAPPPKTKSKKLKNDSMRSPPSPVFYEYEFYEIETDEGDGFDRINYLLKGNEGSIGTHKESYFAEQKDRTNNAEDYDENE